jgi:hypothetical protein
MRIPMAELVIITNKKTPKSQAGWFKKYFAVDVEYDCHGVIITHEAFQAIMAKKYNIQAANEEISPDRPKVKLLRKDAKKKAA